MRVGLGCDHAGLAQKGSVLEALEQDGHAVLDLGTFTADPVDYPDIVRAVANAVRKGFVEVGILVSEHGLGAAIAANKLRGIRAAFCPDATTARRSREEQDANLLCLDNGLTAPDALGEISREWLHARFSGETHHARHLAKIAELEGAPATRVERAAPRQPPKVVAEPAGLRKAAPEPKPAAPVAEPPAPPRREEPAADRTSAPSRPAAAPAAARPATPIDPAGAAVEAALKTLEARDFARGLWIQDARLWTADAEQQALVRNRLGWLTLPAFMQEKLGELKDFAEEIRRLRYSHVVLLGMGGSSLAPEVFMLTLGSKMGFPDLLVLDSTDPMAVKQTLNHVNLGKTLFVVASKSGTTLEPLALYKFFRAQVEHNTPKAGQQFVAITDSGTPLEKLAKEDQFRRLFLNPPAVGGRYSALSYFGLVPAAFIGVDLNGLLKRAAAMAARSTESVRERENPGVVLGATLGALAKIGRDKVTLLLSPKLGALGCWIEQLLAESTGKDGRGLIPVDGEPLAEPAAYGTDRVFVAVTLEGESDLEQPLKGLQAARHPVVRITLKDPLELGAEFFRWEVATATAGALLGVNPFDEPNVQEAKDNTAKLLQTFRLKKRLPDWPVDREEDGILLLSNQGSKPASVAEGIAAHLKQAKPGDYLALLAYLPPGPEVSSRLQALRTPLRDRLRIATTVGYGPRYLHSTGQLHKGGPGTGLFIQLTCDDKDDLQIPGEPYSFGVLKNAQAQGDLEALRGRSRRVIRLHLDRKPVDALERLARMVARALETL